MRRYPEASRRRGKAPGVCLPSIVRCRLLAVHKGKSARWGNPGNADTGKGGPIVFRAWPIDFSISSCWSPISDSRFFLIHLSHGPFSALSLRSTRLQTLLEDRQLVSELWGDVSSKRPTVDPSSGISRCQRSRSQVADRRTSILKPLQPCHGLLFMGAAEATRATRASKAATRSTNSSFSRSLRPNSRIVRAAP